MGGVLTSFMLQIGIQGLSLTGASETCLSKLDILLRRTFRKHWFTARPTTQRRGNLRLSRNSVAKLALPPVTRVHSDETGAQVPSSITLKPHCGVRAISRQQLPVTLAQPMVRLLHREAFSRHPTSEIASVKRDPARPERFL